MTSTIDIPVEIKDTLKQFRFKRWDGIAALVIKINKQKLILEEDELYDGVSVEELAEELPENAPRYVVLSYPIKHKDGRQSVPLVLINWMPTSSSPEMSTLHASALSLFQNTADVSKVIEVRDGAEGLTDDVLEEKLA